MAHDAPGIPTRAIIYCRISRDREGAGLGVERQREDCAALAAQLGIEIHATYSDNDLSAYSGKPRPGYQRLLDDLRAGRADTVLAWHTDRLHRSPAELEEYIDVCEPRAVQTRTVKAGNLDLTTASGRMIARQLGVQARYEVERMAERQKRKRDEMAQRGQFFGGRRPFGYEADGVTPRALFCLACGRDEPADFEVVIKCQHCDAAERDLTGWACERCGAPDGRHVLSECRTCRTAATVAPGSEFERIREAADILLAGGSLGAIVAEWNDVPVPTSTGHEWQRTELRTMLLRPRNAGIVKHRGQEGGPAGWPAALDEPTWRSLAALLGDPDRCNTPGNERKHLGSGLYECGLCADGTTVRVTSSNKTRGGGERVWEQAYSCKASKHVVKKAEPLDAFVQWQLLQRLARPDMADLLAAREEPVDVRGAQAEMRAARQTLDALAADLGAGEMTLQEWRIASKGVRARLEAAEGTLSRAVEVNPVAGLLAADDVEAEWNRLDLSRRRSVVAFMMTVRLRPARRGRLPGGTYFDAESVDIMWK
ncbi:recombinase family protein [Streptomyces asoensis]|uniref:Recombinase family protein n=1 Tax=Streptomyces asoensis TaxID=249586 RepID=A0A6M4WWK6_9ACTN|nr:recombinase family protein [Streptomyces asoensis]QJT04332.1 recombinase family protein [Streptomyces asoensis]